MVVFGADTVACHADMKEFCAEQVDVHADMVVFKTEAIVKKTYMQKCRAAMKECCTAIKFRYAENENRCTLMDG